MEANVNKSLPNCERISVKMPHGGLNALSKATGTSKKTIISVLKRNSNSTLLHLKIHRLTPFIVARMAEFEQQLMREAVEMAAKIENELIAPN